MHVICDSQPLGAISVYVSAWLAAPWVSVAGLRCFLDSLRTRCMAMSRCCYDGAFVCSSVALYPKSSCVSQSLPRQTLTDVMRLARWVYFHVIVAAVV